LLVVSVVRFSLKRDLTISFPYLSVFFLIPLHTVVSIEGGRNTCCAADTTGTIRGVRVGWSSLLRDRVSCDRSYTAILSPFISSRFLTLPCISLFSALPFPCSKNIFSLYFFKDEAKQRVRVRCFVYCAPHSTPHPRSSQTLLTDSFFFFFFCSFFFLLYSQSFQIFLASAASAYDLTDAAFELLTYVS